ncbi:MAG: S-type pyocin domain-containing protein [Pseudomonadota bacterium]
MPVEKLSEAELNRLGMDQSPDWPYPLLPRPFKSPPALPRTLTYQEVLQRKKEQQAAFRRSDAVQTAERARTEARLLEHEARQRAKENMPPAPQDCTFAKACSVAKGQTCYRADPAPFEGLEAYGTFAVLSTRQALNPQGAALELIASSTSALTLAGHMGRGSLSLARPVAAGSLLSTSVAGTVALLWPNTSLTTDAAFYKTEDFAHLSVANIGVRINVKYLPEQSVSAFGVYTGRNPDWRSVPLIAASERGEQLVADLGDGIELIWTPAINPRDTLGIPALQGAPQLPGVYVFPEAKQAEQLYQHPITAQDFRDAIIWFPSKPELSPLYLSLSLRDAPGVATGVGEDVDGVWLAGANTGIGVPIPTRIADQLRGREFSSFDAFRSAFWKAVAGDVGLRAGFKEDNLERMLRGGAPSARYRNTAGKRKSFEIHHVDWISSGGDVYNIDNLRVNTPNNHIALHRKHPHEK